MESQRKYCAFISYRHTMPDKPVAEALHRQLERYRVPRYLRKQGYPSKLGIIFRDELELPTSSDLGHQIQNALDNSEYLIVVCSPQTPHSRYVAAEIDYFKKKKGDHKCLTLLAAGEPGQEKVFPDELLKRYDREENDLDVIEPIAADVRANSLKGILKKLKTAKLKIVAGLLGCNYDDLVRRQREQRLKQITLASLAAVVFFICFGLFLLRQLYMVNESQRQTQLAYAEQSMTTGDHVLAMEQAIAALDKNSILFSKEIAPDTKDSLFKASLIPAFSLFTKIPLGGQIVKESFSLDGRQIILQSDLWVKAYDLRGKPLWEFNIEGKGDSIAAVSPDGTRAALVKTDLEMDPPTRISLWDLNKNSKIKDLSGGGNYQVQDVLKQDFSKVLGAFFSTDGKYICAFRTGGYFNENDTISLWNTETGELEKSFDAALLGTRQDGGQGSIVQECLTYKNGIIRFKGSTNFVFVHPDWDKPVVVPMREKSESEYVKLSNDGRFGIYQDETGKYILKDRSSQKTTKLVTGDYAPDIDLIQFIGQEFAFVPVFSMAENNKEYTGVSVINLGNMGIQGDYLFSESYYHAFRELKLMTAEGAGGLYILASGGSKKVGEKTFREECSTLFLLMPPKNEFTVLSDDLFYLDAGMWTTSCLSGNKSDFLVSRQVDSNGLMKVLKVDPELHEIQNLYQLSEGEEFDPDKAQINADDSCLMVRDSRSLGLYTLENLPDNTNEEECDIFAYSPDSDLVAALSSEENVLKLWRNNENILIVPLKDSVLNLYLSKNGQVLAGTTDKEEIIVWDAENVNERCRIPFKEEECYEIGLSPDGRRIYISAGSSLELYDSQTGKLIKVLADQTYNEKATGIWAERVAFSPDGSLMACIVKNYPEGNDLFTRDVALWNTETGDEVGLIPTSYDKEKNTYTYTAETKDDLPPSCDGIFFSDNGKLIGTTYLGTVWIWDIKSRARLTAIYEESEPKEFVPPSIDDDKKLLYFVTGDVLHVWDLGSGRKLQTFLLEGGFHDYSISPEKRWLVGSNSEGVWLFDLKTGEIAAKVLNEAVYFMDWTNNGKSMLYYPLECDILKWTSYLYNHPDKISRQWDEKK